MLNAVNLDAQNPAAAIADAFALARDGQLQKAEALCHEILKTHSDQPDALLLRAVIEVQTGRAAQGAVSVRRSIQKNPSRPAAHALLGDALSSLNQPGEALDSYDHALRLDGHLLSAHYGRGNALLDLQRPREALASYEHVLASRPEDADAWCKRGNALLRLKHLDAAVHSYDRAICLRPSHAAAFNNRGGALMSLQLAEPALASFDSALAIDPEFTEALCNRGCALRRLERLEESLETFDRALRLRPSYVDALRGRGDVLRDMKRPHDALLSFDEALQRRADDTEALRGRGDALLELAKPEESLAAHDAALRLGPGGTDIYNSRGNSLRALKRFSEAIACYEEALRLDPANAVAHYNRGTAILQADLDLEETVASYVHVLQLNPRFEYVPGALAYTQHNLAEWSVRAAGASGEHIRQAVLEGQPAAAPFHLLSITDSAAAQLRCARTYVGRRDSPEAAHWPGPRHRHDRIRLGYVSADFREHAVSYLMAGVFERHDPLRFETFAISLRPADESVLGQRIKNAFAHFMDVSKQNDGEVTALMRQWEIDIAVDLTGFTDGFRPQIFQSRAAPVQVNYLGFPGTMGARFMDYILADTFVIPPEKRQHYAEQVVYLPECFQANDDKRVIGARAADRAEAGLPEKAFVFCCLNNTYKINAAMFAIWMRLLDRVPHSVLWLLGGRETTRDNLRREAAERGIDPGRLVFTTRVAHTEYLARLELADLFLDTLPFNAGTTANDALGAGLPLLTCAGEAFASRMAGSLLRSLGMHELIAPDLGQYEIKALELSQQPHRLMATRRRLGEALRGAALFDTDRFRRHLEDAYREMWRRHERAEMPSSFAVSPATASAAR